MHDSAPLPTQRLLSVEELTPIVGEVGTPVATRLLSGGTFSAVQSVELADGRTVVAKAAVPVGALPDGRTPLLTYEHDMLRSEHDMLRLIEPVEGVPAPRVLTADFSREHVEVDVVVTEFLSGTPWDTVIGTMSPDANARAAHEVGAILAAMKSVRGRRFGYPAADFALGGDSWPEFVARLFDTVVADAVEWGVDIEAERVLAALRLALDNGAVDEVTEPLMVHNDLWHGNVLLTPETGEVHGIVDFERTLFGDPLWEFVGAESMQSGPTTPALLAGFEAAGQSLPWDPAAGTVTGFTEAADLRTAVYRLWSMSVQWIEIVPRGFHGDWLAGHREKILRVRGELFDRLGV
jgi:aminoglycoside phosphotransferase (APT) family kinase protein